MLELDPNILSKMPFERSISWFQNNKKTKNRHVSFKDEMWSKNKMQNDKIHNRNDLTRQHPSWISYSGHICVLPAIPITRHFEDVLATKWSMTSSFTNSAQFLKLLHLFNKNGPRTHHDIHILFELYHDGCIQFVEVGATSLESNRCWSTNLIGKWMSILAKTFEQSMIQRDLARPYN